MPREKKVSAVEDGQRLDLKGHCTVSLDQESRTFVVRIFGRVTVNEVVQFFREFERFVEENFDGKKFNIALNVDEAAHYSYKILKLARQGIVTQKRKAFVSWVAAVNSYDSTVTLRNKSNHEKNLTFFQNEKDALEFLLLKSVQENARTTYVGGEA